MNEEKSLAEIAYEHERKLRTSGGGGPWCVLFTDVIAAREAGMNAAIAEHNRRTGAAEGWRLLEEGEIIREGDQIALSGSLSDWKSVGNDLRGEKVRFAIFRRRFTSPAAEPKPDAGLITMHRARWEKLCKCETDLADLRDRLASLWNRTTEGRPTRDDADDSGEIIWGWLNGEKPVVGTGDFDDAEFWMRPRDLLSLCPLPEPAKPKDAFEEWFKPQACGMEGFRGIMRAAWNAALAAGKEQS